MRKKQLQLIVPMIRSTLLYGIGKKLKPLLVAFCILAGQLGGYDAWAQLELAPASWSGAVPNGPTVAPQTARLILDAANNSTFTTPNTTLNVTVSISNQQYTDAVPTPGVIAFGKGVSNTVDASAQPVFSALNSIATTQDDRYTNNPSTPGTGISVTANRGFRMSVSIRQWNTFTVPSTNYQRIYMGDVTVNFSHPVSNPILHFSDLGAANNTLGYTSDYDLTTPGVTMTRLSGINFDVTPTNQINNSRVSPEKFGTPEASGAGSGSVRVNGTNISTLSLRVYLRGDGTTAQWLNGGNHPLEAIVLGVSLDKSFTISGTVFNDVTANSQIDGTPVNSASGSPLHINLVEPDSNKVIGTTPVLPDGTYTFTGIVEGITYQTQLSTTAGTVGQAPPAATLPGGSTNTGEGIGPNAPGDGTPNGVTTIAVADTNVGNVNFGILQQQATDLSIVKTGPASVAPNGAVTYKLMVTNSGPDAADGAIVTDPAAANLTAATVTCVAGSGSGGSAACPASPTIAGLQGSGLVIPALPSGSSITLTVTGTAAASGTITNVATVAAPAGTTDSIPANNTSTTVTTIDPTCASQTVYSFDPVATNTAAAATAGANGGTVNLVYNLTSGPAIAGMGTTFTIPMTYTDFNQAFTGSNHTWDRYEAPFGPFLWDGVNNTQVFSLVPNEQSFYTALPSTNTTQKPGIGNTDNFFTNHIANGVLNQLGTFDITIGAVPTPPAGVKLVSESIRIFSTNNASTNGNGNYQAGWWLKPIAQNTINTINTTAQTIPLPVSHGNTYSFKYSAFTDNSNFANDAGGRGVLFDLGEIVFCTSAATYAISGTVHSDPDGGTINGPGTNAGDGLYATLLDDTGTPIATDTVATNGTYSFPNIAPGDYTVVLGTTPNNTAAGVPTGYVNTNEGLTPMGDGTTNGVIPVTVAAVDITTADFAIEQLPTATPATVASQPNPGGTTTVDITPSFTGTDPDGTIDSLYFPTFPNDMVALIIDGTPYDSTNFPAGGVTVPEGSTVLIDPVDGAVTPVIPFSVIDNAGEEDPTPANVSVPFTVTPGVNLSGTVHSDPDGGSINGPGTNAGDSLYATLLDDTGTPIATDTVATNGTYSFPNVAPGDYTVVLGTTPNNAAASVPTGYVNTNEGLTPTGDGTTNGVIPLTVAAVDITTADFAIEQLPTATPATVASQPNPGGTTTVDITPSFTGTDPDGTIDSLYFPTFPDDVVTFTIDGTPYDSTSFPAGGVTVPQGSTVLIDPVDGAVTPVIPFSVIDNAGEEDPTPANVSVPFTVAPGVNLSGTVHSDPDGGSINGPGTNAGDSLYATLLDDAGTPIATDTVATNGTYSFPNIAPGDYTVVLGTTPNNVAAGVPTGYVNTNEGLTPTGDGTTNGVIPLTVAAVDITTADFAIEQLPTATPATVASQPNPGGTTTVDITPSFTGTDPDGTVDSLYFPTFPNDVVALFIDGTPYDSTNFPAGGVTVPQGSTVLIDPVDGAVTPVIPFSVIDNAGEEDPTPANVTVPFTVAPGVNLSGTVHSDPDGGTINGPGTNAGDSLYATLLDDAGTPIATDTVATNGTYSFPNVAPGDYTLVLGTTPNNAAASVPTGYVNTNEGLTPTGDGTTNGVIPVTVAAVDITTADFAIELIPLTPSEPVTTLPQPVSGQVMVLDGQAGNPPALTGSDPEDGTQGAGDRLIITTLPTNGLLVYNDIPVVEDDTIHAYNPTLFAVRFTGSGYTEIIFEYTFLDSAGVQSPPAIYTLNWGAPLPVTLTSFTVKAAGDQKQEARLDWSTTQETRSDRFEIERSSNGKEWAMIGNLNAAGESSVLVHYTFADPTPARGMNFYRLKMIDKDGTFGYSRIRNIKFDIPVRMALYPNPVVEKLTLDVDNISTIGRIQISDLTGKVVFDQMKQKQADLSKDIDMKGLPAGAYVVRITGTDGNVTSLKIVKL